MTSFFAPQKRRRNFPPPNLQHKKTNPKPSAAGSDLKGGASGAEQTPPKHKTEASGFGFERRNGCNGVDDVLFCFAKKTSELPPQPPAQKTNPKPSAAGSDLKGGANGAEQTPPKHKTEASGFGFERRNGCNGVDDVLFCSAKKTSERSEIRSDVVRAVGLEPTRSFHRNLNPARLPIPPCPRGLYNTTLEYYCQHIVDFICLLR